MHVCHSLGTTSREASQPSWWTPWMWRWVRSCPKSSESGGCRFKVVFRDLSACIGGACLGYTGVYMYMYSSTRVCVCIACALCIKFFTLTCVVHVHYLLHVYVHIHVNVCLYMLKNRCSLMFCDASSTCTCIVCIKP